jgi:hypothetical protein
MAKDYPYLRIGTDYFKKIRQPLGSGDHLEKIVPWNKETIKDDLGNVLKEIPKYDCFCLIPDHVNYQKIHDRDEENGRNGAYNKYEPIPHEPKKGKWEKIEMFLNHIFGEQYEIGIDYLTIIWKHPTHILPILCLVSKARNTGKTTFLRLLKAIFGKNMTFNTNDDFHTNFNSGWTSKLIIGVDEVLLNDKKDTEKLKNLSTTPLVQNESKGKDRFEQEFFGKFILNSNDETGFIKIDPEETRFWIRKVPVLEKDNKNLLEEMKKEIPAFIHFLTHREIKTQPDGRMWFTKEQIWTEALRQLIYSGSSQLEREIIELIKDQALNFALDEVKLTPKDIIELLKQENNFYAKKTEVIQIVSKKWGYEPQKQSGYYKRWKYTLTNEGKEDPSDMQKTGRYYTFKKEDFIK